MKKLIFQSGVLLLLLALMSTGHAQNERYIPVFCDQGHSIQDALDRATEGALVDVWGTCNEAVVIETDGITISAISGQTTNINPPPGSVAFTVRADNVEISNLNITGGTSAVQIIEGSSATITNNQMLDYTGDGIFIEGASSGSIRDNSLSSTLSSANSNNAAIFVVGTSSARIEGNTIGASSASGILISAASSALVGCNDISVSHPFFAGIHVSFTAQGSLGPCPNTISNTDPEGRAIFCSKSGSIFAESAQNITAGAIALDPNCEVLAIPPVVFPPTAAPATATVAVFCNSGGRISDALARPAVELTIEITGICEEDVEILRNDVTLRGTSPLTDGIRPAPDGLKRQALTLFGVNNIIIENLNFAGANNGIGINASFGVLVDNCLIEDNSFAGVIAGTASATLTVQDTVITSTGNPSRGIWVANGSTMTCTRCTIENHRTGIRLTNGSFMFLDDSTVRGTQRGVDALSASNFASAFGNTSTIEGVSQFAIRLLDNSSADIASDNINGRIRLEKNSIVTLAGTVQSNPSFFLNLVRSGSSLVARNSASLVGNFEVTEFSNVTLPAGSTVSGSLFCSLGADAVCENPSNVSGTSNCGQCFKP